MEGRRIDEDTLIEIYRPVIEDRLQPSRICVHLTFLSVPHLEEIKNIENNANSKKASELLINLLVHSGEEGWYEQFRQALIAEEYEYLVALLDQLADIKDELIQTSVMRNVLPAFVQRVKPTDLLPHLEQQRVINNTDSNEIATISRSRGSFYGSFSLFLLLSRKNRDWFPKLAYAFKECGYEYILQDYIPDLPADASYENVKVFIDSWLDKYMHAEEQLTNLKSAAKEFEMSFDGSETETEAKVLEGNDSFPEEDTADSRRDSVAELELRPYQQELVESACRVKNALIVAPTGSGKTHIALAIMKEHLSDSTNAASTPKKVAFFVPTRCLVWQQWKMCQKYLSSHRSVTVTGATQPGEREDLGALIPGYDIIVMTPQVLVDALQKKEVEHLGKFTLLVFDECHHTMKGHPYNSLMRNYREERRVKVMSFPLPRVIGLTASVGVGKNTTLHGAKYHIFRLCANLNCRPVQVQREVECMNHYVNNPVQKIWEIKGREHDPFFEQVSQIMKWIEDELQYSKEIREIMAGQSLATLTPTGKHGTEQYKQWLSQMDLWIAEIPSERRRLLNTCFKHLAVYNDGLLLNADCRTEDALDYISVRLEMMYANLADQMDVNDRRLYKLFLDREPMLKEMTTLPSCKNPKLEGLKLMIMKQMSQSLTSRGIVFCRTRVLSVALAVWASQDNDLKSIGVKAGRLTGSKVADERGGMSQSEQDKNVQDFRDGKFRLLIATSVGKQGVDIPECNFVVDYEYVTDEIARIQARGRGRAKDSQHITMGEADRGNIERENLNRLKETVMKEALAELMAMEDSLFKTELKKIQNEIAQSEDPKKQIRSPEKPQGFGAKIMCKNCNELVCLAENLRTVKEAHHMVIDANIWKRVIEKPHKKPAIMSDELKKVSKIHCKKCPQDWGIGGIYKDVKFAILKKGKALVYQTDEKSHPKALREWKELPFSIPNLTDSEFSRYQHDLQNQRVVAAASE